jgi:hypothetical protein
MGIGTVGIAPGTYGYRLNNGVFLPDTEFVHRDFAFQEHMSIPVPHAKSIDTPDGAGFYLTEPVVPPTRKPAVWYIVGIRVPVPCLTVTLWYNGQRQVTLAPTACDVLYPTGPIAVAPGLTVRIEQDFGLHGAPRACTHVLTLAGYFLRDELYAPPPHELDRVLR